MLPGGPLQAQDASLEYAENRMDPVDTFTGVDPEGRPVYWSLLDALTSPAPTVGGTALAASDIADAGAFTISSDGVLSFKLPPDFEMPMSRTAIGSSVVTEGTLAARNVYKIVVVASDDARGADMVGLADLGDIDGIENIQKSYHKVTVTVTDVDEAGSISLSAQQPQVGVDLTATLTDQDATDTVDDEDGLQPKNGKWKWEQGTAMNGPWTLISGQTTGTYSSPTADTVGKYLRATATYTDAFGDDKTAMAVSAHAVRAKPAGTNSSPAFPDEDADTRSVNENSPPGTNVGKPVAAGDAGDILTYSLGTPTNANDDGKYRIDPATGQITVGARTMLDRESFGQDDPEHTVTVTATDPWSITTVEADGLSATTQTVTITIKDVNEAPVITGGPTRAKQSENLTETDATPDSANDDVIVTTYTATDVEITEGDKACVVGSCTWSVSGADAGLFKVSNGTATLGQLTFKKAPNYEKPSDSDKDNVYMVTVVVTDKGMDTERTLGVDKMTATRDVVITVANVKEDGKIKFSSNQPKQGVEFVATLTDDDGPTNVTKWKWERDDGGSAGSATADCSVDSLNWEDAEGEGAKTDTYTPEADDLGKCLRVIPTYTDPLGESMATENMSANAVVKDRENKAPQFKDANNKVITSTTRSVAEDAVTDDTPTPTVGAVVEATDPNATTTDNTEILTYTLGGTDARYFEITDANSGTGQITVKDGTKLDYEKKKSYMVTVTAKDPSLASTTIDVTINVEDVNEGPEFTAPKEGDVDVTVKENTRSLNIYSFRATDPERRTVYWSLNPDSTDESSFTISDRGVLSLNASPNYEDDAGLGPDRMYTVVVMASDDAPGAGISSGEEDPIITSSKTVTVTVEDVEEQGAITTTPKYPHVGDAVEADLTDGDGDIGTVTWEWKADAAAVGGDVNSYTPVEDDVGKTLSVKASYTQDGDGVTITKSAGTVRAAPSPDNIVPTFADTAENNARSVDENARAGTTLGKAIKATDENGDSLTYSLGGTDASFFRISSSSGQLSTAAVLSHEDDDELSVTVTATDPWGGEGTIGVTVTVIDLNEAPMITTGPTRRDREENADDDALTVFTYAASDIDEDDDTEDLTWSIEGEDTAKFDMGEDTGLLAFKESPDYEMPTDRNKDNVYKVTVVVSDDGSPKLTDKRQVEVTVTDVEEDGVVSLSSVQPKVAIQQMAALEDSDGEVTDTVWQWYRSDNDTCPTALTSVDQALITALAAGGSGWSPIPDAESDTYTPGAGTDKDEDKCLLALAKYNDRRGTAKAAAKQSDNTVIANDGNRAPVFKDNDVEITETTREVAENTPVNEAEDDADTDDIEESTQGNIGDPVAATDPNDDDNLTYTLGGTDAASFDIGRSDGQLMTKAKLDYETKNSYMVTVTATDPDGLSDSVDVTIKVMDIDEAPEIIVGGLAITGLSAVSYAEKDTGNVATYMAAGPDAASATWSLSGADMGDFMISSTGVLTFSISPDFETPADANTDNTYMVTVEANDGTNTAMKAVTINVTNVDEPGAVSLSSQTPVVGSALTASLTDADGEITGMKWQWASENTDGTFADIAGAGATSNSYTPADADVGKRLRATASYTDGHGSGKSAMAESDNAVSTTPTTVAGEYDADGSGTIDRAEVGQAVRDFIGRQIEHDDVLKVIAQYFKDLRSGS